MEQKKLEVGTLFEGLWVFIKKEFLRIDSWVLISFVSYFAALCLGMLVGLSFGLEIAYIIYNSDAIFNFQQNPFIAIGFILITLLMLYLSYKIAQKAVGIANALMLNILAAVDDRPLPRFSIRDERLSVLALFFIYFLSIIVGTIFLIIPGIIVLIRFSMSYMIMLDEQCSIKEALQKSWQLTEGNFWQLFVFIFPLLLIGYAVPLLTIFFVFIPLNMWTYGYIYHQLKQNQNNVTLIDR